MRLTTRPNTMRSLTITSLLLLLFLAPLAISQGFYNDFWFNPTNNRSCPGIPSDRAWWCVPPRVCTHDKLLDKWYCCASGVTGGVCRTPPTNCSNSGTQRCGTASDSWCCLASNAEQCGQRTNVDNVCWIASTIGNPFANISNDVLIEVYSSLTSSTAAATTTLDRLSFNYSSLVAAAATAISITTTGSSTDSISSSNTSSTISPSPPNSDHSPTTLSGGAIAGIVISALTALALLILAVVMILRRRRRGQSQLHTETSTHASEGAQPGGTAVESDSQALHEKSSSPSKADRTAELWSSSERFEAPASTKTMAGSPPPPFSPDQQLKPQGAPVELASSNH